jgi:hypothetical protein
MLLLAKAWAVARPMPEDAPVMRAILDIILLNCVIVEPLNCKIKPVL